MWFTIAAMHSKNHCNILYEQIIRICQANSNIDAAIQKKNNNKNLPSMVVVLNVPNKIIWYPPLFLIFSSTDFSLSLVFLCVMCCVNSYFDFFSSHHSDSQKKKNQWWKQNRFMERWCKNYHQNNNNGQIHDVIDVCLFVCFFFFNLNLIDGNSFFWNSRICENKNKKKIIESSSKTYYVNLT